jgi:hypothetical protein
MGKSYEEGEEWGEKVEEAEGADWEMGLRRKGACVREKKGR